MLAPSATDYGMLVLAVALLLFVAVVAVNVNVRMFKARRLGVRVYDLGADLELPSALHSRGYRFALYLTMKSLPRDPAEPARPPLSSPAALR